MDMIFLVLLALILFSLIVILIKYGFTNEIEEIKNEVEKIQNLSVDFVKMEDDMAIFISHELKKMYYIVLDSYDLHNTEMELSYDLQYVPEGWGRHKILHNGKVYKLYEI